MKQVLRDTYPVDSLNMPEQEISIHKALNEISQKIISELTTSGVPPMPNELFPNGQVFIIAGGYARDLVSIFCISSLSSVNMNQFCSVPPADLFLDKKASQQGH